MGGAALQESTPTCTVIGAGSWGTALAIQLARKGCPTRLWGRDADAIAAMRRRRENRRYLPDIGFPGPLTLEPDLDAALADTELVLMVTPSHAFAETLEQIRPMIDSNRGVAWASKGFEPGSGRLLHQVAADILGSDAPLAVATGPSFAREVALDLPTAIVVASPSDDYARLVAGALHGGNFRAYSSNDIIGAELGGAVKNVLAIGTGLCDGIGLGHNSRAALITRGLAEMMRLAEAMGATRQTLMGLSGMGDLVLTCTGDLSRNRRFGLALGQGSTRAQALEEIGQVVEGIGAAEEVVRLARKHAIELPIAECVFAILTDRITPEQGVDLLLSREPKRES
ncbi:MAG: NAD(P)H-dependent glycerol-3-phosphate dehydrogenase [Xanthomonadales bacterium]|nr:NAD(P)H-dependent glycerol-3-phosphate dehydrogenase [Xanthomonadales bacterium]